MTLNLEPAPRTAEIVHITQPGIVHIATPSGSGSGFVVASEGLIITNAHVVEKHSIVAVGFVDGNECEGFVLGKDEEIDLACVRISGDIPFTPLQMGDSDAALVGEDVLAMGYPLGDILHGSHSVTQGIVSAKDKNEIRTNAEINPGNSGGPLIDPHGLVIGVVTSRLENVGGRNVTGINFAIPSNVVKERLAFLASGGTVAKSVPATLENVGDAEIRWIRHDVGPSGFSIALPDWWELHSARPGSTSFFSQSSPSGLSGLFLIFRFDSVGFDLYEEANAIRAAVVSESVKWDKGMIHPLQETRLLGERAFRYEYSCDYKEYIGEFRSESLIAVLRSATGGQYLLEANLEVQEGASEDEGKSDATLPLLLSRFTPWITHWSDRYQWSIAAAPGWAPDENATFDDEDFTLWAPDDDPAYISVSIWDLDDDKSLADLCADEVVQWLIVRDAWDNYEIVSAHENDLGGHDWYRMNFRYQGKDDTQPSFRIVQVGRSGRLEYVITADTYERYLADYATDLDHMMDSFRF